MWSLFLAAFAKFYIEWNFDNGGNFDLDLPTNGAAVLGSDLRAAITRVRAVDAAALELQQWRARGPGGDVVVDVRSEFFFASDKHREMNLRKVSGRSCHTVQDGEAVPTAGRQRAIVHVESRAK